eukprot:2603585-Amphidinium_carterae.4
MQELAYRELGIKSNTFQAEPGLGKLESELLDDQDQCVTRTQRDSCCTGYYWPKGNSECLSEAEVSLRDTFSLKELLDRYDTERTRLKFHHSQPIWLDLSHSTMRTGRTHQMMGIEYVNTGTPPQDIHARSSSRDDSRSDSSDDRR